MQRLAAWQGDGELSVSVDFCHANHATDHLRQVVLRVVAELEQRLILVALRLLFGLSEDVHAYTSASNALIVALKWSRSGVEYDQSLMQLTPSLPNTNRM